MDRIAVEQIIDERLVPLAKMQEDTSKVLSRLSRVVVGDAEFKQLGLVDTVSRHDEILSTWNNQLNEAKGSVRGMLIFGGCVITLLSFGSQWLMFYLRARP